MWIAVQSPQKSLVSIAIVNISNAQIIRIQVRADGFCAQTLSARLGTPHGRDSPYPKIWQGIVLIWSWGQVAQTLEIYLDRAYRVLLALGTVYFAW